MSDRLCTSAMHSVFDAILLRQFFNLLILGKLCQVLTKYRADVPHVKNIIVFEVKRDGESILLYVGFIDRCLFSTALKSTYLL
jgi:hypothetical protein